VPFEITPFIAIFATHVNLVRELRAVFQAGLNFGVDLRLYLLLQKSP
jgi:hypothetical protein